LADREELKDAGGSYGEAAKFLGLHPNNLHRLMKTLGNDDEGVAELT
jgi:DNA-binding NtrC family response regulator